MHHAWNEKKRVILSCLWKDLNPYPIMSELLCYPASRHRQTSYSYHYYSPRRRSSPSPWSNDDGRSHGFLCSSSLSSSSSSPLPSQAPTQGPMPLQMPAMEKELTRRRAAPAGAAETATGATATATTAKAAATTTGGTLGGRRPPPTLGSSLPGRRLPAQGRRRGRGSRRPPASCSLQSPCWMAGSDLVYSEV
ncbi:hypothetical protein PVAP13_2KG131200 [Panicum virgatum]|uniref:Uncharacterized protein n=1 Tax=Panicum virgatum TaxID=38727 RepID=A0A8T0WCM1_PANVG|nr:hypothetical protein PVAP13_2KG131200 [Panicum virgatum]